MTDRESRLAALAARRPAVRPVTSVPADPWEGMGAAPVPSQPPAPGPARRAPRRAPALASRVLVAGLSAAATLGLVASIGAGSMAAAATVDDTTPPPTVVHRIVVVAAPPPPQPEVAVTVARSGNAPTAITLPTPTTTSTTIAVRPKPTAGSTTGTTTPVTTTKASGKKPKR